MKKHTTKITYKSIEQSLVKDFKKAIAEYIWNGFDAEASQIEITFSNNEINYITDFQISDNGTGINFETIDETFGQFLDSKKTSSNNYHGVIRGKKGKGRFSFINFCINAKWKTVYKSEKGIISFEITLEKHSLPSFTTSNNSLHKNKETGTIVEFSNFTDLTADLLYTQEFINFITDEFGWYLFLNRSSKFRLTVNDYQIDYGSIIEYSTNETLNIDGYDFHINFIKWKRNIGEKYYYYFLDDSLKIVDKQHTSFNNKTEDFHHSVYIDSKYFDEYYIIENEQPTFEEFGNTKNDITFKTLVKRLNQLVLEQERNFIREHKAENLINDYKRKNIFPKFKDNQYDNIRKQDLENVIREIYCLSPKIFQGLKDPQSKTIVGFLNLLLDSEQRESVLNILDRVIELTDNERIELSKILEDSKLSNITKLISELKNRFEVISILKLLVFDFEEFTTERDQIQKIIEKNYWLFGEQYHLVSADLNFEKTLNNYLAFIESDKKNLGLKNQSLKLKRPDVFIARQHQIFSNDQEDSIEENIIIELKRPSVTIGKKQYDQIEEYIRYIISEPNFNSELRKWKLILVGKGVDDWIIDQYESQRNKNKKFLVQSVKNYEIYAYRWDDIFKIFDIRHKHLIKNLDFKDIVIDSLITLENSEATRILTQMATDD
ncbi:ATP-binding protein [Flavobacterium sp. RHBU_3]|uniref:ATP-binding protein n=1 Tax=Flavobacterium sp. RHBU_3 TaxID=3391184 RepID=UPI00398557F5